MSQRHAGSRFAHILVVATVVSLFPAAPVRSGELREDPGNPKVGRNLFFNKGCGRCHSLWETSGKRGPNLSTVGMGRNLYELCASIWSHWSQMNAALERGKEEWVLLKPVEVRDIIAYLYYLNYYTAPGDEALGEQLFRKRGCEQCHAVEPMYANGKAGPPVYEMPKFQGTITLAVAVWNHGSDILRNMGQRGISWPELQDKEVAHLAKYIRARNAGTPPVQMQLPGDPARGRDLFVSKSCAACHKTNARERGMGPNLASSGAVSLSSVVAILWNHTPRMDQAKASSGVSYPKISSDEMADILSYVYWLKANGLAGDPEAGRSFYQSKQCASCHSTSGGSPAAAPSLIGSETTESAYALLAAIWNHGPKMESVLRQKQLTWPTLNGEEMRDLIAFFRRDESRPTK